MTGVVEVVVFGVPAAYVAALPKELVYCPAAVGACTGMLVGIIPESPNLTFMSVIVPETNGASHLLFADKLTIAAFAVPLFELNTSALKTDAAVVAGANQIGE